MDLATLLPNAFAARTTDVSLAALWTVVSDPSLLPQFSEELQSIRLLDDGPVTLGSRFEGDQRRGERTWTTTSTVTAYDVERLFEWSVGELDAPVSRWAFVLDAHEGGVTLAHRAVLCGGESPMASYLRAHPLEAPAIVQERLDQFRDRLAVTVEGVIGLAGGRILS